MDQTTNHETISTKKAPPSVVAQITNQVRTANLADLLTEIAALEREKLSPNRQRQLLSRLMLAQVRGIPVESLADLLPSQSSTMKSDWRWPRTKPLMRNGSWRPPTSAAASSNFAN